MDDIIRNPSKSAEPQHSSDDAPSSLTPNPLSSSATSPSSQSPTISTRIPSRTPSTLTPGLTSFPSHIATTAATNITAYATALGTSISDALANAVADQLRLPGRDAKRKPSRDGVSDAVRSPLPGVPGNIDKVNEIALPIVDGSELPSSDVAPPVPPRTQASGIVTVVSVENTNDDDRDLNFLTKIPRFEPLLKTSVDTNFNWGGLFSVNNTRRRDAPHTLDPIPFSNILHRIRRHSKTCVDIVLVDQKLLTERVNSMDEYCAKLANTISGRVYQARQNADNLTKISNISKHAETTRALLVSIANSLDKLDAFLAPGERLDNLENKQRYPAIVKMRNKLSPNYVPSPTVSTENLAK
ncbi:hypothetical protein BC829DRAFT_399214 [Chytridium lagenaria]|nr:hypothetical protein BC829DRAFT_399214 [Chytridium lagenaria]